MIARGVGRDSIPAMSCHRRVGFYFRRNSAGIPCGDKRNLPYNRPA
jgi:hypothetical protein